MNSGLKRKAVATTGEEGTADEEPAPSRTSAKSGKQKGNAEKKKTGEVLSSFTDDEVTKLRTSLLAWYDENHRVLPWRRTPHSRRTATAPAGPHESAHPAPDSLDTQQFAYQVWVSEIMLQQTQVATVLPYFTRWVARWPTVAALAAADMEELRHVWAGLGYYRRAKYLLDGAKHIMDNLGGKIPETAAGLMGIPGVGPYTSAAIGSIAFNDRAAVVDGNVVRVLARLRALPGDPPRLMPTCNSLATQALDPGRPGDFNQALMELGATVCRPKNPGCNSCPASSCCKAFAEWQAYCRSHGIPPDQPPYPLPAAKGRGGKLSGARASSSSKASCAQGAKGDRRAEEDKEEGAEEVDEEEVEDAVGEIEEGGGLLPYVTRFPSKKEAKEKRQQAVAVCVLEVLHPKQRQAESQPLPASGRTPTAGGAGQQQPDSATGTRKTSQDSLQQQQQQQRQQPKKRQRSMLDYTSHKGPAAGSEGAVTHGPTAAVPPPIYAGAGALRGMDRRYLMVQRAEGSGLLAGLWEFPGVVLDADSDVSYKARKAHAGPLLQGLLGPGFAVAGLTGMSNSNRGKAAGGPELQQTQQQQQQQQQAGGVEDGVVDQGGCSPGSAPAAHQDGRDGAQASQGKAHLVNREDVGTYVHTFSHIRQTNYVEVVRIAVEDLAGFEHTLACVRPAEQEGQQQANSVSTSARGKKSDKKLTKDDETLQSKRDEAPRLQWLSEEEMLAACKGGRGNKAGGNGVVGLSTGPRKIYALISKVDQD